MDESIRHFVGIDVAKQSFDVCIFPEEKRLSLSHDEDGLRR